MQQALQIECAESVRLVSNSMSCGMQVAGGCARARGVGQRGRIGRCCRKWPPHLSARLTAGDIRRGNGPRPSWNWLPVAFHRRSPQSQRSPLAARAPHPRPSPAAA